RVLRNLLLAHRRERMAALGGAFFRAGHQRARGVRVLESRRLSPGVHTRDVPHRDVGRAATLPVRASLPPVGGLPGRIALLRRRVFDGVAVGDDAALPPSNLHPDLTAARFRETDGRAIDYCFLETFVGFKASTVSAA